MVLTLLAYCQLSYGVGHWMRMRALLAELRAHYRVVLVLGGRWAPQLSVPEGIEVVTIPAVAAGDDGRLQSLSPRLALTRAHLQRRRQLHELVLELQPAVVLIEYFPFGRLELALELVSMLETCRGLDTPPVVACSLRDVQQQRRRDQERSDQLSCQLANRYLDAVLVHSDPAWFRLEHSFAAADQLRVPILYTGYVTAGGQPAPARREPRIVVSAGGGRGGEELLRSAVAAYRHSDLAAELEMLVIAGAMLREDDWQDLVRRCHGVGGLRLVRWVDDLCGELCRAAVSLSRCGYNTCLDLLASRVPALVVPYTTAHEDEQLQRAQRLAVHGAVRVLHDTADAATLATEIRRTLAFRPAAPRLDCNGAGATAAILGRLLAGRRQAMDRAG